jgi:hypothetical protein
MAQEQPLSEEKEANTELLVDSEETAAVPEISLIEDIELVSPSELHPLLHSARLVDCDISWDAMQGANCVRKCGECGLDVFDLSNASPEETAEFVAQSKAHSTVILWRRSDGRYVRGSCLSAPLYEIFSIKSAVHAIVRLLRSPFSGSSAPIVWLFIPLWACVIFTPDTVQYLQVHPTYILVLVADFLWIRLGFQGMRKNTGAAWRAAYLIGFYVTGALALCQPSLEKWIWPLRWQFKAVYDKNSMVNPGPVPRFTFFVNLN